MTTRGFLALLVAVCLCAPGARAAEVIIPDVIPPELEGLLPFDVDQIVTETPLIQQFDGMAGTIVSTIGILTDHRPYRGAYPLGNSLGLEIGTEVSLVQLSNTFKTSLSTMGMSASGLPPSVPFPRLVAHKGLLPWLDLGASFLGYRTYWVYGGDAKITVYEPEEGLGAVALRLNLSHSSIEHSQDGVSYKIVTDTYTPQIVVSKKLAMAEPYLGIGYQFTTGRLEVAFPVALPDPGALPPGSPEVPTSVTVTVISRGTTSGLMAFGGLSFRIPQLLGFKIAMEGGWSQLGMNTLGAKVGFGF